ncbi:hypothetical protein NQZ68_031449 [Dissostichus eleginoides]|nr:hypothetical protein NQZ68_031449 [Dissostichus eleginoides]
METQTTARMRIAFIYGVSPGSEQGPVTISEEFHRITSKDLLGMFGAAFDKHVPCLLKLYWARKGAFGQKMEDLLVNKGVSVAILTVIEDDDAAISPNVRDVAVVLEGTIVLHDLSTAFTYLFGLLYAMSIDYPKEMRRPSFRGNHCGLSVDRVKSIQFKRL